MKILYAAPSLSPEYHNEWCELIGRRLSAMHDTVSIDYRRLAQMHNDHNDALIQTARRDHPDLLFVIKGEIIAPETIKTIREMGTRCVLFAADDFQYVNKSLSKEFNHVFTECQTLIPIYQELGVTASQLFYPYDPHVHKKQPLQKIHDIVYIGTYYNERAGIIKAYNRMGMPVFGNGWENASIKTHRISAEEMVRIFNRSKIVLNFHQERKKERKALPNLRISEALGCGAFVLTDDVPGMRQTFVDGVHLAYFNPDDEYDINRKIMYWSLPDMDKEREKIAAAGHERIQEFTIDNFIHRVLTA